MAKRGSFQGEIGRVQDPRHATESQRTGTENFGLQIADYRLKLGRCPYYSGILAIYGWCSGRASDLEVLQLQERSTWCSGLEFIKLLYQATVFPTDSFPKRSKVNVNVTTPSKQKLLFLALTPPWLSKRGNALSPFRSVYFPQFLRFRCMFRHCSRKKIGRWK